MTNRVFAFGEADAFFVPEGLTSQSLGFVSGYDLTRDPVGLEDGSISYYNDRLTVESPWVDDDVQVLMEAAVRGPLTVWIQWKNEDDTRLESVAVTKARLSTASKRPVGNAEGYSFTFEAQSLPIELPQLFVPTDLSGLVLWLAADRLPGLGDGGAVAQWQDQSPARSHALQSVSAYRPTFRADVLNGLPVVRFDGTGEGDNLHGPTLTGFSSVNDPAHLFVVGKFNSGGSIAQAFCELASSSVNTGFALFREGTALTYRRAASDADKDPYTSTAFHIFDGPTTQASRTLYEDGISIATSTGSQSFAFVPIAYRLGSLYDGPGQFFLDGDIAEIVLFNRELDTTERQKVERYLGKKYGIAVQ